MQTDHLYELLGISKAHVSHAEKIVSGIGGCVAISSIFAVSQWLVGTYAAAIIVASMGASAVLIFAVPHGPLSQPWPVFGGHLVSAFVGVSCAGLISNQVLAAGLAVGVAISVMYYLRCVHPPGGATALSAVVGGPAVHELGYQYLVTPILLNVMIILLVGVVFNAFFPWRRYPTYWHRRRISETPTDLKPSAPHIAHEDFVYALSEIGSFIDVNEHDLLRIYDLATRKSHSQSLAPEQIELGGYYSNGKYGDEWSVRQVVDQPQDEGQSDDLLIYKVVAGRGRRSSGYTSRSEFARWAKHRVMRDEENWKRVD